MIKVVSDKPILYTPKRERDLKESEFPTKISFKPLSKREHDEYMDSLTEFKRNKVVSKANKAGELLFKRSLYAQPDGVFIYNAEKDGKHVPEIKDKDFAVEYLLEMADIDTANEIEQAMRGVSTLEDEEEKNLG